MRITILEDRPMVMKESIGEMKKIGIDTERIICYKNKFNENETEEIEALYKTLGIEICYVDNMNFNKVLDGYYEDTSMIFFFDLDLLGDGSHRFEDRINVIYAREKQIEKMDGRIWFYTTAPASILEQINIAFPERNIPVERFKVREKQVLLDINFIKKNLCRGD